MSNKKKKFMISSVSIFDRLSKSFNVTTLSTALLLQCLLLASLCVLFATVNRHASAQTVVDTINLGPETGNGESPEAACINTSTSKMYVVNSSSDNVSVIDLTTDKVIKTITVGKTPFSVGVNTLTNKIYVVNRNSDTVSVIDGITDQVTTNIPVDSFDFDGAEILVNQISNKIYIFTDNDNNDIFIIDGSLDKLLETTITGGGRSGWAFNSTTNKIYVPHFSGEVSVIDGDTDQITGTITVGFALQEAIVNEVTNKIYTTAFNDLGFVVSVIDGDTDEVFEVISKNDNHNHTATIINSKTNTIYVAARTFDSQSGTGTDNVTVIDGSTNQVISTFNLTSSQNESEDHVINISTNKIYVFYTEFISIIDGLSNEEIKTVSGNFAPSMVIVDDSINKIYLVNGRDDNLSVISGETDDIIETITVGTLNAELNGGIGINDSLNRIYVADTSDSSIFVIDSTTDQVIKTIGIDEPLGIAVNNVTNKIYVTSGSHNVSVIDSTTNNIIDTIALGDDGNSIDAMTISVNKVTDMIYVISGVFGGKVTVIDGSTNNIVTTIVTDENPEAVGVNHNTNKIYLLNPNDDNISVIDGSNNQIIKTISVGDRPQGIGINSITNKIYITNNLANNVSVIDGINDQLLETISVSSFPLGVGVNETTNKIYIANTGSDNVSVIDGNTDISIETINVGDAPFGSAANSSTNKIYITNFNSGNVTVIKDELTPNETPTPEETPILTPTPTISETPTPSPSPTPTPAQEKPTADFSNNLTSGPAPLTVEFTDESTGSVTEWLWVFGDGGASSEQNPSHTYEQAGLFSVILTVSGSGGSDTIIKPDLIDVSGPPVPDFEANVTAGFAPLAVQFNDLSTGSISNWSWDFGDGGSSTEQNPFHEYKTVGLFTVTLSVSGPGGADSEEKTNLIRALPISAPFAAFKANATVGLTPFEVKFFDISSGDVSSWSWDFGDGATSTEQSPLHEYKTDGAFTVTLTVNGTGGTDSETKINLINTIPIEQPRVEFSATPTAAFEPLSVQFTDLTQGTDLASWTWNFGDGGISSVRSPVHEFKVEGFYSPTLTVSGRGGIGFKKQANLVIAISKGAPVAEFKATPTVFFLPETVTFTDISEGDEITSWTWNFGDGGTSSEQNPTHTYGVEGYYAVTLTVSNKNGIARETKLNLINPVSVGEPLAEFSANPSSGNAPLDVKFTELAEGDIDNYFWDFGDGATSKDKNPTHTYSRLGIFTVSLTVSGPNGANTRVKENLVNTIEEVGNLIDADFKAEQTNGKKRINGKRRRLKMQFTDSSTGANTSWLWDFGDGETSIEQNPLHMFRKKGKYSVSLTVSGPEGSDTETKTDFITVGIEN